MSIEDPDLQSESGDAQYRSNDNDNVDDAMDREIAATPTDELIAELRDFGEQWMKHLVEQIRRRGQRLLAQDNGDESSETGPISEGCSGVVDRWIALDQLDGALAYRLDLDISRLRHVARLSLEDQVAWEARGRAPVVVDRRFGDYAVEMVDLEDLSARQLDQLIDVDSLRSEEDQKRYLESLPRRPRKRPRRPGPRR